jgi:hypothetical protein
MNIPSELYNNLQSGKVYDIFNRPEMLDNELLPLNQSVSNYLILKESENNLKGELFFYNNGNNDINYDNYMLMALSSGAKNFLQSNGFPNNINKNYIPMFQDAMRKIQNNQPTMGPTMMPTMGPTMMPNNSCKNKENTTKKQVYFSLLGALIFFLLSLPFTYRFTNIIFGSIGLNTQSQFGCPTYIGLFLHFIVYFLIVFGIMKLLE